eukprot:COSAG02_NODE_1411_length_12757_cov_226.591642_13_plen_121_part_00
MIYAISATNSRWRAEFTGYISELPEGLVRKAVREWRRREPERIRTRQSRATPQAGTVRAAARAQVGRARGAALGCATRARAQARLARILEVETGVISGRSLRCLQLCLTAPRPFRSHFSR